MRIKSEFVTNSSSCSFVVMGTMISPEDITDEKWAQCGVSMDKVNDGDNEEFDNAIEELTKSNDLVYSFGNTDYYDTEDVMVGIYYTDMRDDETLAEFKARVKQQIKDSFGVEKDPGHIEECWENR